jgi:hypothetical protein
VRLPATGAPPAFTRNFPDAALRHGRQSVRENYAIRFWATLNPQYR